MARENLFNTFYLNSNLPAAQNKINFQLRRRAPIRRFVVKAGIMAVRFDFLEDEMFKGLAKNLVARNHLSTLQEEIREREIKKIKFWRQNNTPLGFFLKRRNKPPQQRVGKYLEIVFYSRPADAAIRSDIIVVNYLAVTESRRIKEAGKNRDITGNGFRRNLLFKVIPYVGVDKFAGPGRRIMPGKQAVV